MYYEDPVVQQRTSKVRKQKHIFLSSFRPILDLENILVCLMSKVSLINSTLFIFPDFLILLLSNSCSLFFFPLLFLLFVLLCYYRNPFYVICYSSLCLFCQFLSSPISFYACWSYEFFVFLYLITFSNHFLNIGSLILTLHS